MCNAATSAQAAQCWLQAQGIQEAQHCSHCYSNMPCLLLVSEILASCDLIHVHCIMQANVRNYFMQFEEAQTQSLIDSKIMEFEMKSRQGLQVNCRARYNLRLLCVLQQNAKCNRQHDATVQLHFHRSTWAEGLMSTLHAVIIAGCSLSHSLLACEHQCTFMLQLSTWACLATPCIA